MGSTATNWNVAAVALGPGTLWGKLAVPGTGGKLTLATDGSPDSVQNPNAIHIGMTDAGSAISVKQTFQDFHADEFVDPIIRRISAEEAAITGSWIQPLDFDLVSFMTPGTTRRTGAGNDGVTFGGNRAFDYSSVALIFPLQDNPNLFGVFHLYKAVNDPGLAFAVNSKELGKNPFAFKGVAIVSRPAGDQTGSFWKQTSIGS